MQSQKSFDLNILNSYSFIFIMEEYDEKKCEKAFYFSAAVFAAVHTVCAYTDVCSFKASANYRM